MKRHIHSHVARCCLAIAMMACCASARSESSAGVKLIPEKTTLAGKHASQQLLLESVAKELLTGDKTAPARFTPSDPAIATVDEHGIVHPVKDGEVMIPATVDGEKSTAGVSVSGSERE